MSAKNITTEKMNSAGMSGAGRGDGKMRVLTKASRPLTPASRGKGPFGGKESKNEAGPSPGKYKG
jgi:hypothetical protein